ncbi:MAG: universal stress protein [Spirulina sp. DLM2.Bin59]|nr:MAG: universal stress protein [Spirulina sp. DLM2.Bin59]
MFQRCLICTDFSDGLQRLIHFVPALAAGGLTQVVFAHIVPLWQEGDMPRVDQEKIDAAQARLKIAMEHAPAGVEIFVEVRSGKAAEVIPKLIEQYHINLVLMGTPTRSLMQETVFGSTTQSLARNTKTPLLILRPQLVSVYREEELNLRCQHLWRNLLIPYNGSQSADYLVERVKTLIAGDPDHTLMGCHLVWVVTGGGRRAEQDGYQHQMATEKLAKVKADLAATGVAVEAIVRTGDPLRELMTVAMDVDISAIAIAYKSRGALLDWTAPTFANEVLRNSGFPVLFFSPKE